MSDGQLALLFVVYVIYLCKHRFCGMEEWVAQHQGLLQQAEVELGRLNPKGKTPALDLTAAAQKVLARRRVVRLLTITVTETVTE